MQLKAEETMEELRHSEKELYRANKKEDSNLIKAKGKMTTTKFSDSNSSLVKLKREKERLNIKDLDSEDDEEIAENVSQKLIARSNLPKNGSTRKNNISKNYRKVPLLMLEKHKLKNMFLKLDQKDKTTDRQKQLLTCLKNRHYLRNSVWTSPLNLINAINDSLLTRNWSNVTYLLLQLINFKDSKYKPILQTVYEIMDKLSPVILENDLQGEYKNIQKSCKQILESTTVV